MFNIFKFSAPIPAQTVGTVKEAIDDCSNLGARLYQPRSLEALSYFRNTEPAHMTEGLFPYAKSKSHIALGLEYRTSEGNNTEDSILYYRLNVT